MKTAAVLELTSDHLPIIFIVENMQNKKRRKCWYDKKQDTKKSKKRMEFCSKTKSKSTHTNNKKEIAAYKQSKSNHKTAEISVLADKVCINSEKATRRNKSTCRNISKIVSRK